MATVAVAALNADVSATTRIVDGRQIVGDRVGGLLEDTHAVSAAEDEKLGTQNAGESGRHTR